MPVTFLGHVDLLRQREPPTLVTRCVARFVAARQVWYYMMILIKWQTDGLVFERPALIPTNNAHSGSTMLKQAQRVIHDWVGFSNETPPTILLRVKGILDWSESSFNKEEPLTDLPKRNYTTRPKPS